MPTTRDHNVIRVWAEARDAHPARVKGTEDLLRFDFDEPNQETEPKLERIGWDEFFRIFDEKKLELLFDEDPGSRFHKFIYPGNKRQ